MVITDSSGLYEKACQKAKRYIQSQQGYNGYGQRNGYGSGYSTNADLELYYVQIIGMMFYELMTKKNSSLLSMLCSLNGICVEATNFSISYRRYNSNTAWDIVPILDGLNTAFIKSLAECGFVFSKYRKDIFQNKVFKEGFDYITSITADLKTLDENISRLLSLPLKVSEKIKRKELPVEPKKAKVPDTILRIHDPKLTDKLNQFAENRRANDSALSEQIQQLQSALQDELKQIMAMREDIEYNITQEPIKQFISLFALLSETLQYHNPNDEKKDSYQNLIESCEDFLENIKQSLALLGVTMINDVGKLFDPEKHKTVRGIQPTRMATISKVVKIGFAYKNIVLEKAVVELASAETYLIWEER